VTEDKKPRAGIKELADALGISIGTVDRALHGRNGVSPQTRDRVLKMARKLNYTPNLAARNLKLNRHVRIGVFLPQQIASFFDPLKAGIRAASHGTTGATVEVVFHSFPRLGEGDLDAMERHDWRQFDGIIMAPGNPARLNSISRIAEEENKTIVYVATDAARTHRLASIAVESAVSGGIAAELLGQIIRENRTVVAITGDLKIQDHAEKLRGFAASLAILSPHLRLLPAIESHESPEDAHKSALLLLERNPDLGGIYINTANSMPVMRALDESGRLGRVQVIATDLFPEMEHLIEAGHVFASLHQRPFTQGKMAFEILSRYLVNGSAPRRIVRLAPHIVLRSNLALFMDSLVPENVESHSSRADQRSSA
jgi:LacI family transcriptional regulator